MRGKTADRAPSFVLALASLILCGCLEPLDPPFSAAEQPACRDGDTVRFLSVAGTSGRHGLTLFDGSPSNGMPFNTGQMTRSGIAIEGESAAGRYRLELRNRPAFAVGVFDVVEDPESSPDGIRVELKVDRPSLGRFDLISLGGEITLSVADDRELAGRFQAAMSAQQDLFAGCFHVDLAPAP